MLNTVSTGQSWSPLGSIQEITKGDRKNYIVPIRMVNRK